MSRLRFVFTEEKLQNAEGGPEWLPSTYVRFIDPVEVVAVVAGNGPTVLLMTGGHILPVDGTPEIVEAKVFAAKYPTTVAVAAPDPEEDPKPSRPSIDSDDYEPPGVVMFDQE